MDKQAYDTQGIGIGTYIAILVRWWWALLLAMVVAGASVYVITSGFSRTYTATSTLLVNQATASQSDVQAARLLTRSYAQLVTSPAVLGDVISRLGLNTTVPDLQRTIEVRSPTDTQIIYVSATNADPIQAQLIANTLTAAFMDWVGQQQQSSALTTMSSIDAELQRLDAEIANTAAALAAARAQAATPSAEEQRRIAELDVELERQRALFGSLAELQQRLTFTPQSVLAAGALAEIPQQPDGLPAILNALIAGILALALVAMGVVLFERGIERIYSVEDITRRFGLPFLGATPRAARGAAMSNLAPPASMSAAFRWLRTRFLLASGHDFKGVVAVTTPEERLNTAATAANFALTLAQSGRKTILVDANMRKPDMDGLVNARLGYGLSHLLQSPSDVWTNALADTSVANLQLVRAGATTVDPADLLTGGQLALTLAQMRQVADVVVVHAPALDAGSDALLIAAAADATMLVVEPGATRASLIQASLELLRQARASVAGLVFYGVAGSGRHMEAAAALPVTPGVRSNDQPRERTT